MPTTVRLGNGKGPVTVRLAGARGPAGATGPKGDTGDQGPTGEQGPQGLPGVNAVENDEAVGTYVATEGTATRTALNTAFVGKRSSLGQVAPPLTGVTVTPIAGPRPVDAFDGYMWAATGGTIYRSTDKGLTWTPWCATFPTGSILRVVPTDDGEVLVMTPTTIYKSSGWSSTVAATAATATWSSKIVANAPAYFLEWSLSDQSRTKFITTEYALAADFAYSRYVRVSLDGGDTWTVAYDSVAVHGAAAADQSHLHAGQYDPYRDRFYFSEGHNTDIAGIYCSTDDGATWNRAAGMAMQPAPTTITATPEGLVCGSDNANNGLYGVRATDDPADEVLRHTWVWSTGRPALVGFAKRASLQPETGVVYVSFLTNYTDVAPIIAAGTVESGSLVYTWPTLPVVGLDEFKNVFLPDRDTLIAYGVFGGTGYVIRGTAGVPGASTKADLRNAEGGTVGSWDSVAVGPKASTGTALRSVAYGNTATVTTTQDGTAVGYHAAVPGDSGTAVGSGATASSAGVAVGTSATTGTNNGSIAIGKSSSVTGAEGSAIGWNATAAQTGVSLGRSSSSGTSGTAIGHTAVSGANSVAVGASATTGTIPGAVAVGTGAAVSAADGVAVGRLAASGLSGVAVGRSASAATSGSAVGYLAVAGESSTALGASATTTTMTNATAIGASASVTATEGTAVGRSSTAGTTASALGRAATASGTNSVAVGGLATASGTGGVAVGHQAQATTLSNGVALGKEAVTAHSSGVALGYQSVTTAGAQVAIGARHVEVKEIAADPAAPAADTARWYFKDNGAGLTQLAVRFNTGAVQVLASEAGARPLPALTTAARPTGMAAGATIFDTTLGKPVWWNGTGWVDSAGAAA